MASRNDMRKLQKVIRITFFLTPPIQAIPLNIPQNIRYIFLFLRSRLIKNEFFNILQPKADGL